MASITNHTSVAITLQTSAAPQTSYTQMFLSDSTDVPIDMRYRDTTRAGYTTDLTSGEETYDFAQNFWSQKRTAQTLRLGRWIKTASSPHFICGDHETSYAVWKLISDGSFAVQDNAGTPNKDILTACDFTGITDLNGILTVLNAKLAAIAVPNITGLDSATFTFDVTDRLVLTNSTTGASAATITIVSDATGTDLSTSTYMDAGATGTDGVTVPGYDAEEPTAAVTAISNINDDWYDLCIRGESAAQQLALAAQIESLDKQLTLVTTDGDADDAAATTDIGYLTNALGYKHTMIIYTEHTVDETGGWPDACVQGAVLPALEGSTSWDHEELTGAYESGKGLAGEAIALTATQRSALGDKGYCWIEKVGNSTFLYNGKTVGGEEKRIILGVHWMQNSMVADMFSYRINTPNAAFDEKTLAAFEGIIRRYLTEAKARGIITDTAARPITITMPTADEFEVAERATGIMELSDVFSAYINPHVSDLIVTGEFRI